MLYFTIIPTMTTVIEFYIPEKSRKASVKSFTKYFDEKISRKIEQGLYNFSEQYCTSNGNIIHMAQAVYNDNLANLIFNFKQNHKTIKKIQSQIAKKKFNPYNIPFLRPDELDEDNWMRIILRKNTTEEMLKNLPTIEWKSCIGCKNTQFYYYQLQTRSADEPMTTFYICKQCGKTYKINN